MKTFSLKHLGCLSFFLLADTFSYAAATAHSVTTVRISIPDKPIHVDARIYGQMLEHLNDRAVYDGIVNLDGTERPHVDALLKPLNIPVVRWPGGTIVHMYHWKNGIGPRENRPQSESTSIGGKESHKFGTDDFIKWCRAVGTEPYINFNMANHPVSAGTLQEALEWIEYTNGDKSTEYGALRATNGNPEPFNVQYWGLGNENYESWGRHNKETAEEYSVRLYHWASAIREKYPNLKLLAVGYSLDWDKVVLQKCAPLIDYLTQHYYVASYINDDKFENPENSLYAPLKMETHLEKVGALIDEYAPAANRPRGPLMISVDEWNNRHHFGKKIDRQDPRRQFDVAVTAGTLNVFIRQAKHVGMANYIFPVNAHGLIRTVKDDQAYKTPIYGIFEQYRKWMVGDQLNVSVEGPGPDASTIKASLQGDAGGKTSYPIKIADNGLTYIDASAVRDQAGAVTVSLVNRSFDTPQKVQIEAPEGYTIKSRWILESDSPYALNTPEAPNTVQPKTEEVTPNTKTLEIEILPTGLQLVRLEKANE